MSHWLSNVNNLLTKLDDQVETVVEERASAQDDSSYEAISATRTGIDDILAKRGLSLVGSNGETEEEWGETKVANIILDEDKDHDEEKQHLELENAKKNAEEIKISSETSAEHKVADTAKTLAQSFVVDAINHTVQKDMQRNELDKLETNSSTIPRKQAEKLGGFEKSSTDSGSVFSKKLEENGETGSNPIKSNESNGSSTFSTLPKIKDEPMPSAPHSPKLTKQLKTILPTVSRSAFLSLKEQKRSHRVDSPDRSRKEIRELAMERKEAQKEARTLRRHIVSLNDQLEIAESELQAQRKELERAAERMEKDRVRHKEEKDASQKGKDEEITQLKTQNEKSLKGQQAKFEEQLERYRKKLLDEEQRRKLEGGDWNKEMSNAIDREHEIKQTLNLLEDEKVVLLSQISTLQGQQAALGSRLESLSQAADNAMDREHDSEKRLDVALNQHARQISHRQARELQLERTIQDLNAALVQSRDNGRPTRTSNSGGGGTSNDTSHFEARISSLESDLQTANSHLAIEKERSETLQIQLRSFSNETTQEANIVYAKEIEYDRQIAHMSTTISNLEAKVRGYEKESTKNQNQPEISQNDQKPPRHVKLLSEEVVRMRDKIANHNSECLAMKNRLKAAVDRSNRLEEELQTAKSSSDHNTKTPAPFRGHNNVSGGRRRHAGASHSGSIRTAMLLHSSQGDRTEQIGEVVDQIDSFAASTGKYLRRNPLARAGFILYLIMIHLWTFVLLFFHAHSFDTNTGRDFGHGPHALLRPHSNIINDHVLHVDDANTPKLDTTQKTNP